jgi:hypothetical protein
MRRGAEAGPTAGYRVQRPGATKRGVMGGRDGELLHSVHLSGSKPSSNCNKKPVDLAAPSVDDDVADALAEPAAGTLQEHFRVEFLRKIAPC